MRNHCLDCQAPHSGLYYSNLFAKQFHQFCVVGCLVRGEVDALNLELDSYTLGQGALSKCVTVELLS